MIGEGMIAVHHFEDGITAYVRFEHDAYNFTSFNTERRVLENEQGLTRDQVNHRLSGRAFISAFKRV